MKYSIYDFSQAELVKYNDSHPDEKLDFIDLMIFRWFTHFASVPKAAGKTAMWRKAFDNEIYYWVNYQALIDEYPLFDIQSKKSISRRFDKYVAGGLMKKRLYKARNKGSLTFFAFTPEFSRLEYRDGDESQKINPRKGGEDSVRAEDSEFGEDADVLSKKLEKTSESPLKADPELGEDADVRSKKLEKTPESPHLNNPATTTNSSTTTAGPGKASRKEAEEEIIGAIKKHFGGHYVFDGGFATELRRLAEEFNLGGDMDSYVRFAYERSKGKNPNSLTSMFYKMALSPAVMSDFAMSRKREADGQALAPCPVCGTKIGRFENCPVCGLDCNDKADGEKLRFERQIFLLPQDKRSELRKCLRKLEEEFSRLSLDEKKERLPDFIKRKDDICVSFGIKTKQEQGATKC